MESLPVWGQPAPAVPRGTGEAQGWLLGQALRCSTGWMDARTSRKPQPFAGKLCFQGFHKLLPDLLLLQEGREQTEAQRAAVCQALCWAHNWREFRASTWIL